VGESRNSNLRRVSAPYSSLVTQKREYDRNFLLIAVDISLMLNSDPVVLDQGIPSITVQVQHFYLTDQRNYCLVPGRHLYEFLLHKLDDTRIGKIVYDD